jgi:hypothetical protein
MKAEKIKLFITLLLIVLGIVGIFYSIIESVLDPYYLRKDFAYTISDKISLTTVGKGGTNEQYTFFLNGKWYAGNTTLPLRRDGTKYFIKFYPPNPDRNNATEVIANSEDIKNLPSDGYKKLPHR